MDDFLVVEVGKPFPIPGPVHEGVAMELWSNKLNVILQMPRLKCDELMAFEKGFNVYSYFESNTSIPVAVWIFSFPEPLGVIDCNFNGKFAKKEYIEEYLKEHEEQVNNIVSFCLLDQNIVMGMKVMRLSARAITLFHATIKKQLSLEHNRSDYEQCLTKVYNFSAEELLNMGEVFFAGL